MATTAGESKVPSFPLLSLQVGSTVPAQSDVTNPLTCVTLQWTVRWTARVCVSLCYTAWLVVCTTVFPTICVCYHTTAGGGRVCGGAGRRTVAYKLLLPHGSKPDHTAPSS